MNDIGKTSFVLANEIYLDISLCGLGLSKKAYISRVLERFNMQNYKTCSIPIVKSDNFIKDSLKYEVVQP